MAAKYDLPKRLNPRFDGAFLNSKSMDEVRQILGLNPRFDGAFLNLQLQYKYVKDYLS